MATTLPERLKALRESLGINKAEAARILNITRMGYGRYESGERTPSYQTLEYMARKFGVSVAFLTGDTDDSAADFICIEKAEDADLYDLVFELKNNKSFRSRMLAYHQKYKEGLEKLS